MIKVMLVYPPLDKQIKGAISSSLIGVSGFPPLQLLILAAQLLRIKDVVVKVVDCRINRYSVDHLATITADFAPDIVGVSVNTFILLDALDIAKMVKHRDHRTMVVFGGVHPTLYPAESINYPNVDYLIRGEGELAFSQLVQHIAQNRPVDDIPGVISKSTLHPAQVPVQKISDLDTLPYPAWHLVDLGKYKSQGKRVLWLWTSRGCSGKCTYCHISAYEQTFRAHSARYIYDHVVDALTRYNLDEFQIGDDCFTLNKARVREFCELLISNNIKARWGAVTRVDMVDEDLLRIMAKAGCKRLFLGIGTGDATIQKRTRKNLDLDEIRTTVAHAADLGMHPQGYFMIGNPGESMVQLENTVRFMRSLKLTGIVFGVAIFQPFPFTAAYLEGLSSGIIKCDYWLEFARNPTTDFRHFYWNEHFSDAELQRLQKVINHKFLFRPVIIYRTVKEALQLGRLFFKIQGFFLFCKVSFLHR